jgi:hypothetical protein
MKWYDYIFIVVSLIIIVLSLLQGGKTSGASGAITGGGLNVFAKKQERGFRKDRDLAHLRLRGRLPLLSLTDFDSLRQIKRTSKDGRNGHLFYFFLSLSEKRLLFRESARLLCYTFPVRN